MKQTNVDSAQLLIFMIFTNVKTDKLNINANGQSVQGGCSSSTVTPSKNDESNRSKHLKSDFNSSQNTESREASRITDNSNCSATSLQQKAIPCLSEAACGSSAAPTAQKLEA